MKYTSRHHHTRKSAYCPATGKRRFRDPREATARLQSMTNLAHVLDDQGVEHRIRVRRKYRCEACNGWHLTSWESPSGPAAPLQMDPLVMSLAASTGLAGQHFRTVAA